MAKILFLGPISPGQTSRMRMRALERLGHSVRGIDTSQKWQHVPWFWRQVQRALVVGSTVTEINHSVIHAAREFRPHLVWAEKQEFLRAETLNELRRLDARLVHFTPDPYFSVAWKRTRVMDEALKEFDALIFCKSYEQHEYEALGKVLIYMALGYCDEIHRPLPSNDRRWCCAVGFIGGWEPRRERLLHALAANGADLKIWGSYWDFLHDGKWSLRKHIILRQLRGKGRLRFHRDSLLANAYQGGEIYSDDYASALTGAKIGLGFLREAWPDQHTTRTFEIPACGSFLLADRTEEHQQFFEEGRQAEYFSSDEELLDKVRFYSANDRSRLQIAMAGRQRCVHGGYSYINRLRDAMKIVSQA